MDVSLMKFETRVKKKSAANISLPLNRIPGTDFAIFAREWSRVDIIEVENETAAWIESRKQMESEANRMFLFVSVAVWAQ